MRVVIITEGGKKIGFGHATRCLGLYQAFRLKGISPEFIINGEDTLKELLYGIRYRNINYLQEQDKLLSFIKGADIGIIDSYLLDIDFYRKFAKMVKKPVYIDDNKRLNYPAGIVVNGSIYSKELRYPKRKKVKYLLGADYLPLRKEFWDIPKKHVNRQIKNVLIVLGGGSHEVLGGSISEFMRKRFGFDVVLIVNSGRWLNASKIREVILKCDICISGGGQITNELARCGVPAIGICFATNQVFNIKSRINLGLMAFVGWHNDKKLLVNIEKTVKDMGFDKRVNLATRLTKVFDGKGALRAVDKIIHAKLG